MRNIKAVIFLSVLIATILCGCTKESDRSSYPQEDFVMVFYCAGFNDLSSDIRNNLEVLQKANLPFKGSRHKLLTFTHLSVSDSDFKTLTPSHLVEISKDFGKIHTDTLLTIDKTRFATDPAVMREVLEKVMELYPGARYGLVFSSHATGWLPAGKYNNASVLDLLQFSARRNAGELPLFRYNENPDEPRVKSIGAEVKLQDGKKYSVEMTIQDMASAIPMHLDYLLFDACLMGGIEVAYEFKDVADKVAFSPTEVLVFGFDYSDVSTLVSDTPNIEGFCMAYYDSYVQAHHDATITVTKSSALPALAQTCKTLFSKYRVNLDALNVGSGIQPYFQGSHHWFYDLQDILLKAGISIEDMASLQLALDSCISYKANTPRFMSITINTYSGLSMYLPGAGDASLNGFYKTLAWNKATNLVE